MVDYHDQEQQQVEALKRWWKKNGLNVIIGIVLALAVTFGWQLYQQKKMEKQQAGASLYLQMLEALASTNPEDQEKNLKTATLLAGKLKDEHEGSGWGYFAYLVEAKAKVQGQKLAEAESILREFLALSGPDESLLATARLRLARVLSAQDKDEEAMKLLNSPPEGYLAVYEEVRGDILRKIGKVDESKAAYEASKAALEKNGKVAGNVLLELKLSSLAQEESL